jgi:hypothetical protein
MAGLLQHPLKDFNLKFDNRDKPEVGKSDLQFSVLEN